MLEILFKLARIHTIRALVDVDKIGAPTGLADRLGGRDKGVRNRDDNVAWLYAGGGQRESNGIRPAGDANTMRRIAEFGELALKFLYLRSAHEAGHAQCISQGRQQFFF